METDAGGLNGSVAEQLHRSLTKVGLTQRSVSASRQVP